MAAKKRTKSKSSSKKQRPSGVALLKRPIAVLIGPGRFVVLALLATGILTAACVILWGKVRDDVLASDPYQVTAADLEISPLPDWIRSDPRQWVFEYLSLQGPLSIMDDNATQRVADAFRIHPWVERVIRVTKQHPARIRVELKYRRPVCMVFCEIEGKRRLYPVDVRGVWLPGNDFNEVHVQEGKWLVGNANDPLDTAQYPIVVNINSAPVGGLGVPWGDERVVGAAEIAAAFGQSWHELKLDRIAPVDRVPSGHRTDYTFKLYTRQGRRILWGRSPRAKHAGEATAQEKIDRLRQHAAIHGGLDGGGSREPIDVRHAKAVRGLDPVAAARREEKPAQRQ